MPKLLLALLSFFILVSCHNHSNHNGGNGSDGSDGSDGGSNTSVIATGKDYFPIDKNSYWKYSINKVPSSEVKIINSNLTILVDNIFQKNNENFGRTTYIISNGAVTKDEYKIVNFDGSALEEFKPDFPTTVLPSDISVNESVAETFDTRDSDGKSFTSKQITTVKGYEDITVQAGTFQNSLIVEMSTENIIDGYASKVISTKWYAKGVGLVKEIAVNGYNNYTFELYEYRIGSAKSATAGCYAGGISYVQGIGNIGYTLNNQLWDLKMLQEINIQQNFYTEFPARVYIWYEPNIAVTNAYSSDDGNIFFGYNLFYKTLYNYNELTIAGILAHEWAHQIQFKFLMPQVNPLMELEADAFAGFYLALEKQYAWTEINGFFSSAYNTGDYNFNSPAHHGTPSQRLAAVYLGVQTAFEVLNTRHPLTFNELHSKFTSTITSNIMATVNMNKAVITADSEDEIAKIATGQSQGTSFFYPKISEIELSNLRPHLATTEQL